MSWQLHSCWETKLSKGDSLKGSFGTIVAMTHGTKEPGQRAEAQGIPHIYSLPTWFVTIGCTSTTRINLWVHLAEQTDHRGETLTIYLLCSYFLTFTMPYVHFCPSFSAGEKSLIEFLKKSMGYHRFIGHRWPQLKNKISTLWKSMLNYNSWHLSYRKEQKDTVCFPDGHTSQKRARNTTPARRERGDRARISGL